MKRYLFFATLSALPSSFLFAQAETNTVGTFSLGTRNTVSMFSDDAGIGVGIGGQVRVQAGRRINTEWFLDYIPSKNKAISTRQDYHFGWSVMYYPGQTIDFSNLLQPYLLAGHCFDYSKLAAKQDPAVHAERWTMATQAGAGTHINITRDFDCSLSAQYMLHFGKEIETNVDDKGIVSFEKKNPTGPDGHVLLTVSFNYKLGHLWHKS